MLAKSLDPKSFGRRSPWPLFFLRLLWDLSFASAFALAFLSPASASLMEIIINTTDLIAQLPQMAAELRILC